MGIWQAPWGSGSSEVSTSAYELTSVTHTTTPITLTSSDLNKVHKVDIATAVVNLPVATGSGKRLFFWKVNSGSITITANGAEVINGLSLSAISWINNTTQVDVFIEIEDRETGVWALVGYIGTWETV